MKRLFCVGAFVATAVAAAPPSPAERVARDRLERGFEAIRANYAGEIDMNVLVDSALRAMTLQLDAASDYRTASEQRMFRRDREAWRTIDTVYYAAPGVLYIKVGMIARGATLAFADAVFLRPFRRRLIVDLRGNPGGILEEAKIMHHSAPQGVIVLIDGQTASAAEVFALKLKRECQAVIIGSRSYGKSSIQRDFRVGDGAAMHLTVGYTDVTPIEPDIVSDDALKTALEWLNT